MNAFQPCRNIADAVPLYLPQQLFLKPAARINVSIQIPNLKKCEKSISHWEIMEKLRTLIRPDEFSILKVSKTTLEIIRFEAEIENRTRLDKVLSKLENNSIKLKEIPDLIRVKAGEEKSKFPTRQKWDTFFLEARDMDEMKPGQRPDTMHLTHLPIKWFVPYHVTDDEAAIPSEKIFYRIFEKFGSIRYVDIPICDPYRKKMKDHISGMKTHAADDKDFFEGYVQFMDYIGFTRAMDAFRGMKLLKKDENDEAFCANIRVDFDRLKHLSDASIRRREIVRDRLVKKQKDKEEKEKNTVESKNKNEVDERESEKSKKSGKEKRRKEREAKRKARILDKLKVNDCEEINDKIAKEEKKLLKAQRKLESIRLIDELFQRIKDKKDEFFVYCRGKPSSNTNALKRYKDISELEVLNQRQKLHHAIEGRVVLRSILSDKKQPRSKSSSSSASSTFAAKPKNDEEHVIPIEAGIYNPAWYPYPYGTPMYTPITGAFPMYPSRGRPPRFFNAPGPSRGFQYPRRRPNNRFPHRGNYRGSYNNSNNSYERTQDDYIKYYSNKYTEHDHRRSWSRARRRSDTRDRSRSRSRRSYSRSYTRSRSRSRSRRSRSKTAYSNYTPSPESRRKERRSTTVDSSKFVSPKSMRKQRSKSWSMPRSTGKSKEKSWSKTPEKK